MTVTLPPAPDKAQLVNESYAIEGTLSVRIEAHRRYSVPHVDLPAWALDWHRWRGDETVLDIGTGTGQYLAPLRERVPRGRIIAGDLAWGMLRDLRARGVPGDACLLNADAEVLPLADESCDAIIASYVMFFVPDIPRAVAELHRILRPGGILLAVTLAHVYMEELRVAMNRALSALGASNETSMGQVPRRFDLDTGMAYLEQRLRVTTRRLESEFVFPSVEPVLAYVNSMQTEFRDDLPPNRTWDEFMAVLRDVIQTELAVRGEFRVSKNAGVLIAVK
jgi:SAM-dependent methyltransferase